MVLEETKTHLNKYVEQCEVWFTTFATNPVENHQVGHLINILENLNNGFFKCIISKNDNSIVLLESTPRL